MSEEFNDNPMFRFTELSELVKAMEEDFKKFYLNHNKAAGTRLRQSMQELKTLAQSIRTEIIVMRTNPEFGKDKG